MDYYITEYIGIDKIKKSLAEALIKALSVFEKGGCQKLIDFLEF